MNLSSWMIGHQWETSFCGWAVGVQLMVTYNKEINYNETRKEVLQLISWYLCLGGVTYRSRYLRGDTYKANMEAKRIVISEMGTMAYPDPRKNIFSKQVDAVALAAFAIQEIVSCIACL